MGIPVPCVLHRSSLRPRGHTVQPPQAEIEPTSSVTKNKSAIPYSIHACELDPFLVETTKMAGAQAIGRPNTGSDSAAGAHLPSPTDHLWPNG